MYDAADQHCMLYEGDCIMAALRQYILTIISATIIGMIILSFIDKKSSIYSVLKLLCGIFLIVTLIAPFNDSEIIDFSDIIQQLDVSSDPYVQNGEHFANYEKETFIKEKVVAYVLDRAKAMNINIDVGVELKQDLSGPEVIYIAGNISPYKKEQLQSMIANDLGVTKENQIWE